MSTIIDGQVLIALREIMQTVTEKSFDLGYAVGKGHLLVPKYKALQDLKEIMDHALMESSTLVKTEGPNKAN